MQKHLNSTSAETWPTGRTGSGIPPPPPEACSEHERKKTEMHKELIQWGTPHGQGHCHAPHGAFTPKDKLPTAAFFSIVSEFSGTSVLDPDKADSPEWHLGSLTAEMHSRRGSCLLHWLSGHWDALQN